MIEFKVAKTTQANKLAAAIINDLDKGMKIKCIAIGKPSIENLMYALCIVQEKVDDIKTEIMFANKEKEDQFKLAVIIDIK